MTPIMRNTAIPYAPPADPNLGQHWYIRVGADIYGSFDDQTLWTFVCEGRVTAQSELSRSPATNFRPASECREIAHWFAQAEASAAPMADKDEHMALVMADIRSGQTPHFMHILQSLGQTQRIGDSVWLIRSIAKSDALLERLSASVTGRDRLFVVDVTGSDHASANLGPAIEMRVEMILNGTDEAPKMFG